MDKIKISEKQLKCLEALAGDCCGDYANFDYYDQFYYFGFIAEKTGLPKNKVRVYVRALARKGLAEYQRGLFDDDGFIAGSGHAITKQGIEFLKALK